MHIPETSWVNGAWDCVIVWMADTGGIAVHEFTCSGAEDITAAAVVDPHCESLIMAEDQGSVV